MNNELRFSWQAEQARRSSNSSRGIPAPSDAAVVDRVLLGETSLFEVLFDRYAPKVFGYLWHFSKNREDCEDYLQDTFYRAYTNLKYCKNREKFSSWLFSIAHNVAVSNSRKIGFIRSREVPERALAPINELVSTDDINTEIIRQENREVFKKIFEEMPEHYKQTTVLFYYNDFSVKEISAITSAPVNTVKTRLHRGREFLGKKLREEAGREAPGLSLAHYPHRQS